jgi:hypothetical protein
MSFAEWGLSDEESVTEGNSSAVILLLGAKISLFLLAEIDDKSLSYLLPLLYLSILSCNLLSEKYISMRLFCV